MEIKIELTEKDVKRLVIAELSRLANIELSEEDVTFQVKASMNYKSEWEGGQFRASIHKVR
jgi:hypothetical protein